MTDNYRKFPQQRLTRKAKEHIKKVTPQYEAFGFSGTTLASAAVLAIPVLKKGEQPNLALLQSLFSLSTPIHGNGSKPAKGTEATEGAQA